MTKRFGLLLSGGALAFTAVPALAQVQTTTIPATDDQTSSTTDTTADAASPTPAANGQITDIVVTAQRRSENLQRVPISVTAVTAESLAAANVSSTASLQNVTPALTFSNVNGFLEPRLRGIGSSSAGASVENSVATYVDGVYLSSATGSLLDLSSVQRVEVLKGPQGTLFGRNATGGLVQVVTLDPRFDLAGKANFSYGNYDTVHGDYYVTGPITSDVAADLSLAFSHQGKGFGTNLLTGQDVQKLYHDISVRSKVLMKLSPDTTVRFAFDFNSNISSDPTITLLDNTANADYVDANRVPIRVRHDPRDVVNTYNARHGLTAYGLSMNFQQDFGFATLTNIIAYRDTQFDQTFDADSGPAPTSLEYFRQRDEQFSEELQLSSRSGGKFSWVAGLYYFDLNSEFDPFRLDFGIPVTRTTILRDYFVTESLAGYAQATYEILPRTNLTGGFRYTTERRTIRGSNSTILPSGATTTVPLVPSGFRTNTPTWRVSLDHRFSDDVMAYVSWNRGFKSGGYNSSQPTAPAYKPEYLDAYEAGVKSVLFGRTLRFNAAGFYYNYRDVQVNTYQGSIGIIYNGAKARTYGADIDADLAIGNHLTLTAGATLLHDRFTEFPVAAVARFNANGTVTTAPGSAKGNRLPFAPDVTITAAINYKTPIAGGEAQFSVNNLYNSGFYSQADNFLRQGAYDMLGASVSWTSPDEGYRIKLYANNLLDEDVVGYLSAGTRVGVSYLPPLTYGASFSVKF